MDIYDQLLDQQQAETNQGTAPTQTSSDNSGTHLLYNDGLAQQRSETNQPLATNPVPTNSDNTKQPDIYDQLLDQQQAENDQRLHTILDLASQVDPEQAAQAAALAKRLSLPVEAIANNLPEAQRRTQMADVVSLANSSPALKRQLSNPEFAKKAHDDTENLSAIEQALKFAKDLGSDVLAGQAGMGSAVAGYGRAAGDIITSSVDTLNKAKFFDNPLPNELGPIISKGFTDLQHNQDALQQYLTPQADGNIMKGVHSGIQSLSQNIPMLAGAVMTGNPTMALNAMSAMTAGQSYGRARDKGADVVPALVYSAADGVIEYGTEKFAVNQLFSDLKIGAPIFKTIMHQAATEVPGEETATVLQDFNEWAVLHPEQSLQHYLDERPGAAAQTLVATLVGMGGNVALLKAVDTAQKYSYLEVGKAKSAEKTALKIEQLNKLAAASKVLARSPDAIKSFAEDALTGSPVQDLYIDAQTFLQSGVAEHVAALLPDVAEQLKEALPGTEIRIPISDYLTHIAATDYAATLKDHLRLEGDDYSPAQAQSYMQTHAEELQHEIDAILTSHQHIDDFRASQEAVKATVLAQLNQLNRFTSTKNELDATLISARMAVRGAQLGITPEQMYEKQTPNFAAESVGGGMVYGQTEKTAEMVTARWQKALSRIKDLNFEPNFDTPLVIKHMGVIEKFLPFPVKVMKQVLSKHKDLPAGVIANLPALLANPLFVFPHKDGGISIAIDAKTTKGEPLLVGIREGRVRTITPLHHSENISGTERLNNQFRAALHAGEKVYARNKNALTEAKAFDLALVGDNYQGRYNKSKKRITTNEDLVKKYGDSFYQSADETPRLAPNGKPSNLNPLQYAQVRTAAFKKWFGDWLYNPEMEMTPIKLVDDPNLPIDGDAKALSKYLRDTFGNTKEINQQTGNEIGFYRDGIEASVKNRKLLSRRLYAILPQLLRESAYAGYEENTKLDKKPHVLGYETYYAAVSIDGKVYSVRIAVDRIKNDVRGRGYYYHQVDEVSLGDEVGSTRVLSDSTNQVSTPSSPNGKIILSQLTGKVNNDASKVVDENGEPLVVYHGTPDGRFTEFREDKQTSNTKFDDSSGFFFTPDKKYAESYADWEDEDSYIERLLSGNDAPNNANKDIKPVYLRIINPIDANTGHKGSKEIFNAAKENGNDGVFSNQTANKMNEIVAFNPSQIKSATSNNGGFSKESNDIHKALFFGNTAEILELMKRL